MQMNTDNSEPSDELGESHRCLGFHLRPSALSAVQNVSKDRDPETYAIIGAAMDVQNELGRGFLEGVYQDALEVEFKGRGIPFLREYSIPISYRGVVLGTPYRADFLCFKSIIVELKAIKALSEIEDAQVLHYLKATGLSRAMLINFGSPRLECKRFVQSSNRG